MRHSLTVYSRPDCHLCDEMLDELSTIVADSATVTVIDISGDDELEVQYGLRIPVLCAGDDELCCYRLDRERVIEWLRQSG